ncbi:flagellar basal body rod protein FlgF [Salinicola endophyticus]|uniref:Flagellar basal-body rod protein FlgF n=1 Tax=Salinicola endophyticus TaxID=1949083 RepID=A0ABY8FJ41_9GAMM|nr:flagellar basal body rod protein FlgF [Salinicola endophyticus]WFF42824.1 flagellar basal body rod protein FlgF [Salinicola endophyticus]
MDRILYTAGGGASQTMAQQAVVNNNLANVSTPGFRGELMAMRAVPVEGEARLPTRVASMMTTPGSDFTQGNISTTGRSLDVALQGDAWLAVQPPGGGEAYTRRGDLQVDATGLLTSLGNPVMGDNGQAIVIPVGADVTIGADGSISVLEPGQNPDSIAPLAKLKLVAPGNENLVRGEDGLFRMTPPPGQQNANPVPADDTLRLVPGALEGSNVTPTDAMISMIDSSRRYDMHMKMIESADENEQRANSLLSLT